MPITEVLFKAEYVDRDSGEAVNNVYTITSQQFAYILKSRLTWTQLYNYLNSIAKPESVEE